MLVIQRYCIVHIVLYGTLLYCIVSNCIVLILVARLSLQGEDVRLSRQSCEVQAHLLLCPRVLAPDGGDLYEKEEC